MRPCPPWLVAVVAAACASDPGKDDADIPEEADADTDADSDTDADADSDTGPVEPPVVFEGEMTYLIE